jgi:hypothetical protein
MSATVFNSSKNFNEVYLNLLENWIEQDHRQSDVGPLCYDWWLDRE